MQQYFKNQKIFFSLVFLILSLTYSKFFFVENFMIDKPIIIDPLTQVTDLESYLKLHKSGKILDLQPLRDLSHIIDLKIINATGFENFPLVTNLLILLLSSLYLYKIFEQLQFKEYSLFLTIIFIVHPSIFHIFIEFTSRKHILSFLFFLLSYYYFLKSKKIDSMAYVKSVFFYSLICITQPINILTPIIYYDVKKNIVFNFKKLILFGLLACITAIGNLYYFEVIYEQIIGVTRTSTILPLDKLILTFALYFRQFFLPIIHSNYYFPYSFLTLVFIFFSPVILLYSYKKNKKLTLISLTLLSSIFTVLYARGTTVYFLNTYLLTPFLAFLLILKALLSSKTFYKSYFLIPIILFSLTIQDVYDRKNKPLFYEAVVEKEPNCRSLQYLTEYYMRNHNPKKFVRYGSIWLNRRCAIISKQTSYIVTLINTFMVLHSTDFSFDKKIELFKVRLKEDNDIHLLSAYLYLKNKDFKNFESQILRIKHKDTELSMLISPWTHLKEQFDTYCKEKRKSHVACSHFRLYTKDYKNKSFTFHISND